MSEARNRWLNEGVKVLADEGFGGVRIDRLATRLGLSKGSFHHHFEGAEGFKALLAHIEEIRMNALHRAVAEAEGKDENARDIFMRLITLVDSPHSDFYLPELEMALRAWSLTDAEAARTQANIDRNRLEALQNIWRRITPDEEESRLAALLPYVIALGANVIIPPVDKHDLRRLFERILPLVPEDATVAAGENSSNQSDDPLGEQHDGENDEHDAG